MGNPNACVFGAHIVQLEPTDVGTISISSYLTN